MRLILFTVITLVYKVTAQEDCVDGDGITLLGTTYDCSHLLTNKSANVGIYARREFYCSLASTDCCATCEKIPKCLDTGVYIAEIYKDCKYLLSYHNEDEKVGIYKNRHKLCNMPSTQCCTNCKIVQNEASGTETSRSTPTTRKQSSVVTNKPVTKEVTDTCVENCLWYGDGNQGECSWLKDRNRGVYKNRRMLCSGGFARGCARTCQEVMNEVTTPVPTTTTQIPTTVKSEQGCSDYGYVRVDKTPYQCTDLVNAQSNIYNNRDTLCASTKVRDDCCASCHDVDNLKPNGVIRYSEENTVIKSSDNEIIPPTAARQTQYKLISYDNAMQLMKEQRETENMRMQNFLETLFTFFKSYKVSI